VVKNKVAPPFRSTDFDILFKEGISSEGDLIDLGVSFGFPKKQGSFFAYGETRLGQGRENAREFLKAHPEMAAALEKEIRSSAAPSKMPSAEDKEPAD
jgi:recombination protein RecA